jgi:hypothetical protein
MQSPFLHATRRQVITLAVTSLIAIGTFYNPLLRRAMAAVARRNPVSSDRFQAVIPRTWLVDSDKVSIRAWVPCSTNFCNLPTARVTISKEDWIVDHADLWESSAEAVFRELGFSGYTSRVFRESEATIKCLDSTPGIGDRRRSVCIALQSGIFSSFEGMPSELNTFYSIVRSVKAADRK